MNHNCFINFRTYTSIKRAKQQVVRMKQNTMARETAAATIDLIVNKTRHFYQTGETKVIAFRLQQLQQLKRLLIENELKIYAALKKDLNKSKEEAYLTEYSPVLQEIDLHIKQLKNWAAIKRVPTPIYLFPSSCYIQPEPLGVVLIVAPWNYPFQLVMLPLIGAISAGNCAVVKPSLATPTVANLVENLLTQHFDTQYVAVVLGEIETNQYLFQVPFDLIFFTGSSYLGRIVMEAAAKNLTPVVLELGGKSPCIVAESAQIDLAAKRIAWGKTINAGQTCTAPDYLFIHESLKNKFIESFQKHVHAFFGENPATNEFYPKIIHQAAVTRLAGYLQEGKIVCGGDYNIENKYVEPAILTDVSVESRVMQEEIFGPILPLFTFTDLEEVVLFINNRPKPLALYYFGDKKTAEKVINETASGGVCINDVLVQVANHHLPFGGVGNSGMGSYHGHKSFETFSHNKSVLKAVSQIDFVFRYVPFKYLKWVKKII